jgi:hypothetical protein
MKKTDAEPAIRSLASKWFNGLPHPKPDHPSFFQFKDWCHQSGYGDYFDFRSTRGAQRGPGLVRPGAWPQLAELERYAPGHSQDQDTDGAGAGEHKRDRVLGH